MIDKQIINLVGWALLSSLLLAACAGPASPVSLPTPGDSPAASTAIPLPGESPASASPTLPTPSPLPPSASTPTVMPAPVAPGDTGVEGRVETGPTCGNQPQPGQAGCANQPYQAQLTITDLNGQVVAQSQADADGFFQIPLPPGEYTLLPESTGFLSASPIPFKVHPGAFTYVPILYQTHIQ